MNNTYTVAVGESWHPSDGTPAPDYTCGHKHKSLATAHACGRRLYRSRYVRGSWTAVARWHGYYVVHNETGHRVSQ
jgi:hypothetical protein